MHSRISIIYTDSGHFRVIFLAITGDEHLQSLQEIMSELPDMKKYVMGSQQANLPPEFIAMDEILLHTLPVPLSSTCLGEQSLLDPVCYIYTSGTTGGWFKPIATARAFPAQLQSFFSELYRKGPRSGDWVQAFFPLYTNTALNLYTRGTLLVGQRNRLLWFSNNT